MGGAARAHRGGAPRANTLTTDGDGHASDAGTCCAAAAAAAAPRAGAGDGAGAPPATRLAAASRATSAESTQDVGAAAGSGDAVLRSTPSGSRRPAGEREEV